MLGSLDTASTSFRGRYCTDSTTYNTLERIFFILSPLLRWLHHLEQKMSAPCCSDTDYGYIVLNTLSFFVACSLWRRLNSVNSQQGQCFVVVKPVRHHTYDCRETKSWQQSTHTTQPIGHKQVLDYYLVP